MFAIFSKVISSLLDIGLNARFTILAQRTAALCKALVEFRLYCNNCSSVWSPPVSSGDSHSLEKVQVFALKLCSKNWSSDYSSLFNSSNLPTLSSRRTQAKIILTFKFLNDLHYFPLLSSLLSFLPLDPPATLTC